MASKDGFEHMAKAREAMRDAVRCWVDERATLERQITELEKENARLVNRLTGKPEEKEA